MLMGVCYVGGCLMAGVVVAELVKVVAKPHHHTTLLERLETDSGIVVTKESKQ